MSRLNSTVTLGLLLTPGVFGAVPVPTAKRVPLPLVFAPGGGPAGSPAQFVGRNSQYTLRLSSAGLEVLPSGAAAPLRIRLEGANRQPELEGVDRQPGHSFYYLGSDPKLWRTNVPNYAKVRYRSVYPGIDMLFYGNAGQLEYDLVLAPHAAPGAIRLRFEGARKLGLEANGDLRIETASGVLWQKKPAIYQEGGSGRRQVPGRYVVEGKRVRFALDPYDSSQALTIDPVLVYATYFGGSGDDNPQAMAVDAAGNTYITGYTTSPNYPVVPAGTIYGPGHSEDVFVTKIDPTGQTVLYSVLLGGNLADEAHAIAVDSSGSAYVAGATISGDFPVLNYYQRFNKGAWDAFIFRLDPDGVLLFSTYIGGGQKQPCGCDPSDYVYGIALDSAGNPYITGITYSADYPYSGVTHMPDNGDAFVTEFSPTGKLIFSTLVGGSGWDWATSIAIGPSGMVYIAGGTASTDLAVSPNAAQRSFGGLGARSLGDAWVAKVNPQSPTIAGLVVGMTYLGGEGDDQALALTLDASENLYVAGWTTSRFFPATVGAYQNARTGGSYWGDGFVTKLDPTLSTKIYSTFFGGSGDDVVSGIQVDAAGNAFLTGFTQSTDITPAALGANATAIQPSFAVGTDGYLAKLSPSGNSVPYFTYLGRGGVSWAGAIGMDAAGHIFHLFGTNVQGMPVVLPALQAYPSGSQDIYLEKIDMAASPPVPVVVNSIKVSGGGTNIAQNTWIEIYGTGLAPAATAGGVNWNNAPDFLSGKMPTSLSGVSVKVNGKPAYVNYVSPTQINVLTPLDTATGPVTVTVTNGGSTSTPFNVNMTALAPSFLLLAPTKYIAAQHADYSLLGPASMSVPGYPFTPAQPGEIVILYGTGFGLPSGGLVDGLSTQTGALPNLPVFTIGGLPATVWYAGVISPGLYQFNVAVPPPVAGGDVTVAATYGSGGSPAGSLISVAAH